GQSLAVGAEGHTPDRPILPGERENVSAAGCVPQPDGTVFAAGGHALAVPTEGHGEHSRLVSPAHPRLLSDCCIPDLHAIRSGADKATAVGTEGQTKDLAGVSAQSQALLPRRRVPHLDHPISRGAGDSSAIGAEYQGVNTAVVPAERGHCLSGPG